MSSMNRGGAQTDRGGTRYFSEQLSGGGPHGPELQLGERAFPSTRKKGFTGIMAAQGVTWRFLREQPIAPRQPAAAVRGHGAGASAAELAAAHSSTPGQLLRIVEDPLVSAVLHGGGARRSIEDNAEFFEAAARARQREEVRAEQRQALTYEQLARELQGLGFGGLGAEAGGGQGQHAPLAGGDERASQGGGCSPGTALDAAWGDGAGADADDAGEESEVGEQAGRPSGGGGAGSLGSADSGDGALRLGRSGSGGGSGREGYSSGSEGGEANQRGVSGSSAGAASRPDTAGSAVPPAPPAPPRAPCARARAEAQPPPFQNLLDNLLRGALPLRAPAPRADLAL